MKSTNDNVAQQGIEFWGSVCGGKSKPQERIVKCRSPSQTSRYFARGALQYLVPILLQRLCEQKDYCEDDEDDDEINLYNAAAWCFVLLSSCVEDEIFAHVMPFINENIESTNWHYRDAALAAFGSIIVGQSMIDKLKPIVEQAMPMLIALLKDNSVQVRDSAAWTIGRICEAVPEAVTNEMTLHPLLEGLVVCLADEALVVINACSALCDIAIAIAVMDMARPQEDDEATPDTYVLSKYFDLIVEKLLAITERANGNQNNLRSLAYEALVKMIKNSPKDCFSTVQKATIVILGRLENAIRLENSIQNSSDRRKVFDLQSLLCDTLQSALRKVTHDDALHISDRIMTALLHMLDVNSKASSVQEDAFLAMWTLIDVLDDKFIKYMESLKPVLYVGLRNFDEYQVCQAAVGVVGDLGRNISIKILPFCDELMTILLEGLISPKLNKSVKPLILSTFGDVALAIGVEFKKYADEVLNALHQAASIQADPSDVDIIDYFNDLHEGCLDAYSGIIQGLKGNNNITGIGYCFCFLSFFLFVAKHI